MRKISVSDLKTFIQCRWKWHYTSPLMMNVTSSSKSSALQWGIDVHQWLDDYYSQGIVGDFEGWTQDILDAYVWNVGNKDRFEILETEQKYSISIPSWRIENIKFVWTCDGLVRDKDGDVWILEHKTTGSLPKDNAFLLMDNQALIYQYVMTQRFPDLKIKGTIYNYIRRKEPKIPEVLKKGSLSRRKDLVTTPSTIRKVLDENGLHIDDYQELIDFYNVKVSQDYFRRFTLAANKNRYEQAWQDALPVFDAMLEKNPLLYPTASTGILGCNTCQFMSVCLVRRRGGNWKNQLKANYVRANDRYKEIKVVSI